MAKFYHIYADETYSQGPVAFAFGALICSPRRAQLLSEQLRSIRNQFDCRGEVKWNKTSLRTLSFYTAFADVFFDDPFSRFSLMKVVKGNNWYRWAVSEEERFFKSYFVFLLRNASAFDRYNVYLDDKPIQKQYRWSTLHFLFNRHRRETSNAGRRNIAQLKAVDSQSLELLQLNDLLLGASLSAAESSAKIILKHHVSNRFLNSAAQRLRSDIWTPAQQA